MYNNSKLLQKGSVEFMYTAAVLGATGYAGIELVRLLTNHPEVEVKMLVSHSFVGKKISEVYPNLRGVLDLVCEELDVDKAAACDGAAARRVEGGHPRPVRKGCAHHRPERRLPLRRPGGV